MHDAFAAAVEQWPREGVRQDPERRFLQRQLAEMEAFGTAP